MEYDCLGPGEIAQARAVQLCKKLNFLLRVR